MKKSTKQRPFIVATISEDDKNKSSANQLKEDTKQTGEQHRVTGEHQNESINTDNKESTDPQLDEFFKVTKSQFLVGY